MVLEGKWPWPWDKAGASHYAKSLAEEIKQLPQSNSGAVILGNIPRIALAAARFYSYLVENYAPAMGEYAAVIDGAIRDYIPSNLNRCGYYEVDNAIDSILNNESMTESEIQINKNLKTPPTARGVSLNRENLLRILRYEPDESFRKEAYIASVEAHPENAELFREMLQERLQQGTPPSRVICDNPVEFLESYAKKLTHDGRPPWNWTYVGQPSYQNSRQATTDALAHIAQIFNIEFYQVNMDLWAPEMPVYEIGNTGRRVVLDLWNRPDKIRRVPMTITLDDYIIVICFYDDKIDKYDLITFYHEMGHALHSAYSRVRSLFVPIEDDFGEIPGVVMEYLADPNASCDILIGRQVALGLFDQYVHRGEAPELAARAAFTHWLPNGYGHYWQSFEHYSMGYGGRYYSYALAYWYSARLAPIIKKHPDKWLTLLSKAGQSPAKELLNTFLSNR